MLICVFLQVGKQLLENGEGGRGKVYAEMDHVKGSEELMSS